ncbi:MAG: ARMT1-like domain-containing protein [Puniceicoccaceae bacterium]
MPSLRAPEVWKSITGSDLVLCKGMANFENYSDEPGFFSLFLSKCDLVSRVASEQTNTPVKTGDWIFLRTAAAGRPDTA